MTSSTLQTDYAGKRGALFKLALWSSVLTVLTAGFYRFWMKTRLRRYYWSAIRPGGQPLEYVGEPLEKLLGFLIAVTFLAFYIGIVNLLLMFLSFSIMNNNLWAYGFSFVGILPILFFARYRARRYILARTRWRGVRLGMEQGAWGYTWRALLHWGVTILSLGLLWPRMTFWLEKYRTDRTYFGSERFNQGGKWTMLYRPMLHIYVPALAMAAIALWVYFSASAASDSIDDTLLALEGYENLAFSLLLFPWFVFGLAYFSAKSFERLTNAKTVGPIGFISKPRPWRVFWIYAFGYGLISIALTLLIGAVGIVFFALIGDYGPDVFDENLALATPPLWMLTAVSMLSYFAIFILWGALKHVLVTLPLARHFAETLQITGSESLSDIAQRDRDELDQAEGFAEALDVGAAL
ncbi:MAG: DUF898 family protein [Paracoccaceae bacterium]